MDGLRPSSKKHIPCTKEESGLHRAVGEPLISAELRFDRSDAGHVRVRRRRPSFKKSSTASRLGNSRVSTPRVRT